MSSLVSTRTWAALLIGMLSFAGFAAAAFAQGGTVTGRVTRGDGTPLANAQVFIEGTTLGRVTDASGSYSISVPSEMAGRQVIIRARMIGHTPQQQTITLGTGAQSVNFTLEADPFRLGEVVVTGVATGTEQRKLPFTVARVSEDQLKEVPGSSPVAAIAGKVAGARISTASGNPGSPPAIRLRGSTNLALGGSAPLIIVDGVITASNISDLDANDIESIEILKGATASSYYGSNAANGVVNITTKRGRGLADDALQIISRSEYGTAAIANWVPLNTSHQFQTDANGEIVLTDGSRTVESDFLDKPYPTSGANAWRNQLKEWMKSGAFYSSNLQVGLRRGNMNFNSSFTTDHNSGIVPLRNGQYRQNARLNVDQGIGEKMDVSLSMTYGSVRNDHPILNTDPTNDAWFALLQAPPDVDLRTPWNEPGGRDTIEYFRKLPDVVSPSARGNPLYQLKNEEYTLTRERFLGSASARYRPLTWLSFDANYGTDRLSSRERLYQFKGYLTGGGLPGNGALTRNANNGVAWNGQLASTATGDLTDWLRATTRVAAIYEQRRGNFFQAAATRLNVAFVPDLAAAARDQVTVNSDDQLEKNVNYLANQTLDIKDRYILDVMWRRDGSSLFGEANRFKNFYRLSGAWRVSEDFRIPGVQELKLRAGRGTAGLRPEFTDQYETYDVGGGQISKTQLGNRNLRPAVQTEDEFGINVTFLDRFNLELVQANRVTEGAFLNIPLSLAQSGGFTRQVRNAADVSARTTELSFQAQVLSRPDFTYSIGLTGDRTRQKIDKLGRAPFRVGGTGVTGQGQDMFYYKEGESLGIIYGTKWVTSFAELKDDATKAAAVESDYMVNPLGYLVAKSAPAVLLPYVSPTGENQHVIGDANPDFNFGFSNSVRWKAVSMYALFDGQQGGDVYNFTKQWMFQDYRHGDMDMRDKPEDQKVPFATFIGSLYNGQNANTYFVEDGSYVKLRELSLALNVPTRLLESSGLGRVAKGMKIALIGRNLLTWTNYTGFDPDVVAGGDFNFRVDGFRYPNFRTITGQVEFTF